MSYFPRRAAALAAPLALAACLTSTPTIDPHIAMAAHKLQDEAARFHARLVIEAAPQCGYEQNKHYYDGLHSSVQALQAQITTAPARGALTQAGKALARLVEDARASHLAASERTDDPYGPCMAPGAIALNAEAFDRATSAIAASQNAGDQQ